jgi:hypothetical protein
MSRVHHSCPDCGCGKTSAPHVAKHKCRMCGGSWSSFLSGALDTAKKVASNPMVQNLARAAAPHAMAYVQKKAPGLVSAANRAVGAYHAVNAHPLGNMALSAARQRVGMGRRRRGAMLPLGNATAGEAEYANMRAAGRRRRCGGKKGGPGGLAVAGQVLGAIPGAAEALGPFGSLLGMEAPPPPPPPPPHASFQAVRAGPMMARRPHATGRGRRRRGGFGFGDLMNLGKSAVSAAQKVASNPMVQHLARAAAPHAMAAAQRYAPGAVSAANRAVSAANRAVGAYHAVNAHPLGNMALSAARQHVGMGRRRRGPTAHSLAVGQVMKQTGMGLGEASRYVKENGLA